MTATLRLLFALVALTGVALLAAPFEAEAQWRSEPMFNADQTTHSKVEIAAVQPAAEKGSIATGRLILNGAVAGAVAAIAGAHIGSATATDPYVGVIGGWLVGSTVAIPLAVHLTNDQRGSLGTSYGIAALVGAAGLAGSLALARSQAGLIFFLGAPLAQVATSVELERRAQ